MGVVSDKGEAGFFGYPAFLFVRLHQWNTGFRANIGIESQSLVGGAMAGHASFNQQSAEKGKNRRGGVAAEEAQTGDDDSCDRAGDAFLLTDIHGRFGSGRGDGTGCGHDENVRCFGETWQFLKSHLPTALDELFHIALGLFD